ncbi:unnamed protein product [Durusdinium trenchii]|uniref:EGF-like domain-containing protein n=1 Tax=Durusdinium trenchii TaxID=1381693 RepID=A0ABP0KN60_9DINO
MRIQDTVVNLGRSLVTFCLLHVAAGLDIVHVLHRTSSASSANVVSDVAGRFASLVQQLHTRDAEQSLLDAADAARQRSTIQRAQSMQDKALLEDAYQIQEESRMEEENAQGMAASFAATLQQFSGQREGANSCTGLTCGGNGYCDESQEGARCRCKAGYEGTGLVCNPASAFVERPLISGSPGTKQPEVADLYVTSLRDNGVAVVFRDISRQNSGFLVIGLAQDSGMRWSAPSLLSQSAVFGPVLAELEAPNRLAIAFRTADRGGDGVLVGARRDADNRITLGAPRVFAHYQAQTMALLALPQSRVVVLFSEHQPSKAASGKMEHFGTSLLAEIMDERSGQMAPRVLGKYHFAQTRVSRLSAAPLSSKTFAIAYRELPDKADSPSREASVALAELWGSELVFTTKPMSLEPREQIWARSVAGLGDGAFAYTYHSGKEEVTKQVVLRLNAAHRLEVLQEPRVIASGFSPFVSTVSTVQRDEAQPAQGHRLFTFLGGDQGAKGRGRLCGVNEQGLPDHCQDVGSSEKEVLAVAATLLSDQRVFLLTSSASGVPYYTLVGLAP